MVPRRRGGFRCWGADGRQRNAPLAQDGPAGLVCGENDNRCRNCSTGVFALSRTRKPVIRALGLNKTIRRRQQSATKCEHRASTPQLLDFDQTVIFERARISVRPLGMDRIDLLLLGIIVGLAVPAIVALFAGRMPF